MSDTIPAGWAGRSRAVCLGLSAGLRTFTPVAALGLSGRGLPARAPRLAAALALGELVADKLPATPSRLEHRALAARAASGALAGATVAGPAGAALAAAAALGAAYAGYHGRIALGRLTGWPDPYCALPEDAIAVALAWSAARA